MTEFKTTVGMANLPINEGYSPARLGVDGAIMARWRAET